MSKLSFQKKQTEYLNQSRDSTQFWHIYEKVIGRKTNNTVEPIFDSNSSTYIFDDEVISNILHDCHDPSQIFFGEEHIKDAINKVNKNSSPGPR